jgi:hypothetical protein
MLLLPWQFCIICIICCRAILHIVWQLVCRNVYWGRLSWGCHCLSLGCASANVCCDRDESPQDWLIDFYNPDGLCLLCSTNWMIKYNSG